MRKLKSHLFCFLTKTNLSKREKASLDANFRNILNLSYTINGHVLCQNRKINSIDNKFALFFPKTKDGNT